MGEDGKTVPDPIFGLRWPGPGYGLGQGQARPLARTVAQEKTTYDQ